MLLCSSAGPSADCFMPAMAQMIAEMYRKQNRPLRLEYEDASESLSVSPDTTIEYSFDADGNDNEVPVVYSDISE